MEHLSNDHKDNPNQQENNQKCCNKKEHPPWSKARWKYIRESTEFSSDMVCAKGILFFI